MTVVLGISPDMWISSAALIIDGDIVAACPEERLNRSKMSKAFPLKSINFCLKSAGLDLSDVDEIAIPWNPGIALTSASSRYSNSLTWRGDYLHSFPSSLLNMMGNPNVSMMEQVLSLDKHRIKLSYVNHHLSHIASAYFGSGFSESANLTIDGRGEVETGTWSVANDSDIDVFKATNWPHSIGLLYSAFTEYLGFSAHTDEWKVMALAAYGRDNKRFDRMFDEIVELKDGGDYEMDLSYFTYYWFDRQPRLYGEKLVDLFGAERSRHEELGQRHMDIAAALQRIFEKVGFHLLTHLYNETKIENLCFAGGSAMNSVFNGKIRKNTKFKNIYIPAFPDDSGSSIGAALLRCSQINKSNSHKPRTHNYFGPRFSNDEVATTLEAFGLSAVKVDKVEVVAAERLADGKLVGWFQGCAEFGQRALGNRSILADPRGANVQDRLNSAVKFREGFRPFAPSILEEYVDEYFEIPAGVSVPFMEAVYPVKQHKRSEVPAVVFVDGSGRLQTVSKLSNPRYHRLISSFLSITGVPMVVNTSFNLNGEPVVSSPTDAIRTFFSCGLDVLFIEDWLITK